MILRAGAHLGPYEILAPAGAGGMGEVYKARDTRLERIVAIKVLANAAGALAEVRQRFEREARAVSAINHPHICSLFDIGQQDRQAMSAPDDDDNGNRPVRLCRGRRFFNKPDKTATAISKGCGA